MTENLDIYKNRLKDYMARKGHPAGVNPLRCPNPDHADKKPTAHLYDGDGKPPRVYCPVCSQTWDIFNIAGFFIGSDKFVDQKRDVEETLNITPSPYKKTPKKSPEKKPAKKAKMVPIDRSQLEEIYNQKDIMAMYSFKKWGDKITKAWPYYDINAKIIACDIRIEFDKPKNGKKIKNVITIYYDGKKLKADKVPVLIFNLPEILSTKNRIVFHEGCKCAKLAKDLPGWTSGSWSGGCKKANKIDFKPMIDAGIKEIWYYPDDDQKTDDTTGKLKNWQDQPGYQGAKMLQEHGASCGIRVNIIPPYPGLTEDGADIEQVLEIATTEEIAAYFIDAPPVIFPPPALSAPDAPDEIQETTIKGINTRDLPFRPLGTADDKLCYFIGINSRIIACKLTSIGKRQMQALAPATWWKSVVNNPKKWDEDGYDFLVKIVTSIDFDPDKMRGIGAWRDGEDICYFDGQTVHGPVNKNHIYIRKTKQDSGLKDTPATFDLTMEMLDVAMQLSFTSPADTIRALGWATMAPFGGCLPARPSFLLTGEKGSGKSIIANNIIKSLSNPLWLSGNETTPAFIRARSGRDSLSIVLEEVEGDTLIKSKNREDLFSLMRASYSDDAPVVGKGTKDGGYVVYNMRSMFGFVGIDPSIPLSADESRIIRILVTPPQHTPEEWKALQEKIDRLFTEKNARMIRARTWQNIHKIIDNARRIESFIFAKTRAEHRFCQGQGLLLSAYLTIWQEPHDTKLSDKTIKSFVDRFFEWSPYEEVVSESEKMMSAIMEHVVQVEWKIPRMNLREVLTIIKRGFYIKDGANKHDENADYLNRKEIDKFKRVAAQYGLAILRDGRLAIQNRNSNMIKNLRIKEQYHLQLKRHKSYIETKQSNIPYEGPKSCTLYGGII